MRQARIVTATVALLAGFAAAPGSAAGPLVFDRNAAHGPQGDTWASIAKLPDWSGAWALDDRSFAKGRDAATGQDLHNPNMAPLTSKWEALREANGAANGGRGPAAGVINNSAVCIPNGMPGLMGAPLAFQFVYAPGLVLILPENNSVRRIFTDGRSHPGDPDKSFNGDSIGYWDGDSLVVDTLAITRKAEFFMGLKTSGKTHVIERMHLSGKDTFAIDFTVTDPLALAKPWSYTRTYKITPRGMMEYVCQENNRDNNGEIDLTPPPPDDN
jgi:hypothetical protein